MILIWVPTLAHDPFLTCGWGPVPGTGASTSALLPGWSCGMGPACQALPCPVTVQQQVFSSHRFSPSLCVLVLSLMVTVGEWGNCYIEDEALTWICWPILIFTWDNKMTNAFGQSSDVKKKNYRGRSETWIVRPWQNTGRPWLATARSLTFTASAAGHQRDICSRGTELLQGCAALNFMKITHEWFS